MLKDDKHTFDNYLYSVLNTSLLNPKIRTFAFLLLYISLKLYKVIKLKFI